MSISYKNNFNIKQIKDFIFLVLEKDSADELITKPKNFQINCRITEEQILDNMKISVYIEILCCIEKLLILANREVLTNKSRKNCNYIVRDILWTEELFPYTNDIDLRFFI